MMLPVGEECSCLHPIVFICLLPWQSQTAVAILLGTPGPICASGWEQRFVTAHVFSTGVAAQFDFTAMTPSIQWEAKLMDTVLRVKLNTLFSPQPSLCCCPCENQSSSNLGPRNRSKCLLAPAETALVVNLHFGEAGTCSNPGVQAAALFRTPF